MNKKEIIGAIGLVAGLIDAIVEQEMTQKKASVVGKYMVVNTNLHTTSVATDAETNLKGCLVQIVSEPYAKEVGTILGKCKYEFVKVRSVVTDREYEVLFSESWLVEVE